MTRPFCPIGRVPPREVSRFIQDQVVVPYSPRQSATDHEQARHRPSKKGMARPEANAGVTPLS